MCTYARNDTSPVFLDILHLNKLYLVSKVEISDDAIAGGHNTILPVIWHGAFRWPSG